MATNRTRTLEPVAFVDDGLGNSSYLVDLGAGRALVVDCAIRTGESLQGIASELRDNLGAVDVAAFYVMDSLYDWKRDKFQREQQLPEINFCVFAAPQNKGTDCRAEQSKPWINPLHGKPPTTPQHV